MIAKTVPAVKELLIIGCFLIRVAPPDGYTGVAFTVVFGAAAEAVNLAPQTVQKSPEVEFAPQFGQTIFSIPFLFFNLFY